MARPAAAEGRPPASSPPPAGAFQDYVYLGDSGPVLLRVHVFVDGKPILGLWERFLDGLFRYLDRDGDGVLSKDEAAHVPSAQVLFCVLQERITDIGYEKVAPFAELDAAPKNGVVTRDELSSYYRLSGAGGVHVQFKKGGSEGQAEGMVIDPGRLTEALFRYLDTDRDGKLTRDELGAAAASLRKLDWDEDELIAPQEIVPGSYAPPSRGQPPGDRAELAESPFLPLAIVRNWRKAPFWFSCPAKRRRASRPCS
jgi:Ca2+-binding EF-hand superfamily protein